MALDLDTNLSVSGTDADPCATSQSKTALYYEAVSGDQGLHKEASTPGYTWWESPDILLNAGTVNDGFAITGQQNEVAVRPHHNEGCPVPIGPGGARKVKVDIYSCTPFMTTPLGPLSQYVHKIGTDLLPDTDVDPNGVITTVSADRFDHSVGPWTPSVPASSTLGANDPQANGHKCLIARVYANGATPDTNHFHVPDDPHYAQRNITIQAVSNVAGQMAKSDTQPMGFDRRSHLWHFGTLVGNREKRVATVRLQLTWDPKPPRPLLDEVRRFFKRHELAFERFSNPPKKFGIPVRSLPKGAKVTDHSHSGKGRTWEATVKFKRREYRVVPVQFDLSNLQRGDAVFLHGLTFEAHGRVTGGITWVLLMT
jgi:hypothetical protein